MKRIISLLVALVVVLSVPFSCLAAVDFVQSITYKPAPGLTIIEEEDGDKIIGYIRDEEGNIVTTEHENCTHTDCIIVTPVSEAKTTTKIPRETADSLLEEYNKLTDPSYKLSNVEGLDEKVKNETEKKYGADDLVIRDMFNITEVCDNIKLHLPKDGYTLELTFNVGIGKDDYITAMVYNNGKWTPIKGMVNNGDGTVTCFFDSLGHVAFLVPVDAPSGNVPTTGDTSVQNNIILWVAIMAVSTCTLVILAIVTRRKKSDEK